MAAQEQPQQEHYPWKRRWRRWRLWRAGWETTSEVLETHEMMRQCPVLILKGDAGIGKSHEMRQTCKALEQDGALATFINLRTIARAGDLKNAITQATSFQDWIGGAKPCWTLFLDGFDESCVPRDLLGSWLGGAFRLVTGYSTKDRTVRIRIASRTAAWSQLVENDLKELWGLDAVHTYKLLPIEGQDIKLACSSPRFLAQLQRRGLTALAEAPLTLGMLCRSFAESASLPNSAAELYLQFVTPTGSARATFLVAVLGRIAAASILGRHPCLYAGPSLEAMPPNALDIMEMASGHEIADGKTLAVTSEDMQEAIHNGPFGTLGSNTFEWTHLTIAEFLAARWLLAHASVSDIFGMISFEYFDMGSRICPYLQGLAGWLARLSQDFRLKLIDSDADVLLVSHIANSADHDRRLLLETFLARFASSEHYRVSNNPDLSYDRLHHPTIASQLRPYLLPSARSTSARKLAIKVAAACNVVTLLPDLLEVARRQDDNDRVRSRAIAAVGQLGSDADREQLVALLLRGLQNDPQDFVRDSLLEVLWPSFLSYEQFFAAIAFDPLCKKKRTHSYFLADLIPKFTQAKEVVAAFQWLERLPDDVNPADGILAHRLVEAAFERADRQTVRRCIADLYIRHATAQTSTRTTYLRTCTHDNYRKIPWQDRRNIFIEIFKATAARPDFNIFSLRPWPLLELEDLDDIIGDAPLLRDEIGTAAAATVISTISSRKSLQASSEEANAAWIRDYVCPHITRNLAILDSRPTVDEASSSERTALPAWHERIDKLIEEAATVPNEWCALEMALLETLSEGENIGEFWPTLSRTPGWKALDMAKQKQVLALARRYLELHRPTDDAWLGTLEWNRPAAAAYRAFRLLAETPSEFSTLADSAWKNWAGAIVGLSWQASNEELEIRGNISDACRVPARQQYSHAVCRIVEAGVYPLGFEQIFETSLYSTHRDAVWNSLHRSVRNGTFRPGRPSTHLVMRLVSGDCQAAHEFAKEQLKLPDDAGAEGGDLSFGEIVGATFVLYWPRYAWPFFSIKVAKAPGRARAMLAWIADRMWIGREGNGWKEADDEMLADVWEWIGRWRVEGSLPRGKLGNLGKLSRSILKNLGFYSVDSGLSQLERLSRIFPDEKALKQQAEKLLKKREIETWPQYAPSDLLALSERREARQPPPSL